MIELRGVEVIKTGKHLLKDFSWQINDGEHWVIQGANGSGKTILLELLAGTIHPAQGEVHYDFVHGQTWDERYQERKQKILYIPAHAIQTFLTGYHELFYQQRYYHMGDEAIPFVKDILGEDKLRLSTLAFPPSFNVEALLDLEVTRLSNGQLKKVLILKNLLRQIPRLLLLDYPFEGLDHESRLDLLNFIDHIARTYAVQVVLVDHHEVLPQVINKRLTLHNFQITGVETVSARATPENDEPMRTSSPQSNGGAVVEIKNLTIQYGERKIISNFNWSISKGERWALTGKNGSGKTTLFSLIFADHPMAYSQQVYLFGKRRGSGESIWDIKNKINYLGPELVTFLDPKSISVSAWDYITTQHKNATTALQGLVEFFEAQSFIHLPVKHLSSGQLQLMLLMNYFLSHKQLLLLDEPFQFLDVAQKARVNDYLQRELHEEVTLVLITHYEKDVARWTEKTMRL